MYSKHSITAVMGLGARQKVFAVQKGTIAKRINNFDSTYCLGYPEDLGNMTIFCDF